MPPAAGFFGQDVTVFNHGADEPGCDIEIGRFTKIAKTPGGIASPTASNFVHMDSTYNLNSQTQSAGATLVAAHLAKCAATVEQQLGGIVRVGEYGCATGGSSIAPLNAIQKASPPGTSMVVHLNDLPLNSWDVLKDTVETEFEGTTFNYVPKCMYEQPIATPGSLDLGYTVFAQHWLSKGVPTKLDSGCVWGNQLPQGHPSRARWADASAKDWERFLELRAKEFAPGGCLAIFIQSSRLDGTLSERFASTVAEAKAELVDDGVLSEEEAAKMANPEYLKSSSEILRPFMSHGAIHQLWEIKEMRMSEMTCPYREAFDAGSITREQLVEGQVGNLHSFMNPSLAQALKNSPDASEKLEQLWDRTRRLGMETLGSLDNNYTYHILVLKRNATTEAMHTKSARSRWQKLASSVKHPGVVRSMHIKSARSRWRKLASSVRQPGVVLLPATG